MPREWLLDRKKYLSLSEVGRLKKAVDEARHSAGGTRGEGAAMRDWVLVNLVLGSGLRVQEAASLRCCDVSLGASPSKLFVRKGKNGRSRVVYFNGELKTCLSEYLSWKQSAGEAVSPEAPVFYSARSPESGLMTPDSRPAGAVRCMSKRALQKSFKRSLARAGLPGHYSIHCLRHTYGTHLLKSSRYNHRLVQEQLGHARLETTQIYTHVLDQDMEKALERLYR